MLSRVLAVVVAAAFLSMVMAEPMDLTSFPRTLLCSRGCGEGCSNCLCGKCKSCEHGYDTVHSGGKGGHFKKHLKGVTCVKQCDRHSCGDYCTDCGCDGTCYDCEHGYYLQDGWCKQDCNECCDYCSDCGCDGTCHGCEHGYYLKDGWCEVEYAEKTYVEKPSKKPKYVHADPCGESSATADAYASGRYTNTHTNTDTGCGYSKSSSHSYSSG